MSSAKCVLKQVEAPVAVEVADGEAHARLRVAVLAVARRRSRTATSREGAVVVVAVEDRGRRVAGDVDVGPAVAVEVGGRRGHRVAARHARDARGLGHVAEAAVALVVVEQVRVGRQPLGPAVHGDALPEAVRALAGLRRGREVEARGSSRRRGRAGRRGRSRRSVQPEPQRVPVVASPAAAVTSSKRPSPRLW